MTNDKESAVKLLGAVEQHRVVPLVTDEEKKAVKEALSKYTSCNSTDISVAEMIFDLVDHIDLPMLMYEAERKVVADALKQSLATA